MLDVDGGHDVDTRVQQVGDVLPPLVVPCSRGVRVGELVHERDPGGAGQDGVQVHLLQTDAPVVDGPPGDLLQVGGQRGDGLAAVCLHESDDHVLALVTQPQALLQHGVGLSDTGGGAEEDPQPSAFH